jgi:hypothetical protein
MGIGIIRNQARNSRKYPTVKGKISKNISRLLGIIGTKVAMFPQGHIEIGNYKTTSGYGKGKKDEPT